MDLAGGLNQVLEVGTGKEVAEVDKLAVGLVLDVDDTPTVLAAADRLAVNDDRALRADNGERKHVADALVQVELLGVKLVTVEGVQPDLVVLELSHDALLEGSTLLKGKGVRLGDNRDNVDDLAELLEDSDVDGLEGVAGGVDEEDTAVDAGVGDEALTHGGQLLAEVSRVLVLDVLDDRVPALVIVDEVSVTGGVDDVQLETDAVLNDD